MDSTLHGTMQCPYPFDQDFLNDLLYEPRALLLDRIESFDEKERRMVCRMPTNGSIPFMDAQRVDPIKHPRHVSGAAMVHVTGMLGFVHVYYMLGLRHLQGWTGYGTHIHKATFRKLAPPGSPLMCSCKEVRARFMGEKVFVTYEFEFRQEMDVVYESKQSAMWLKVNNKFSNDEP